MRSLKIARKEKIKEKIKRGKIKINILVSI